VRNYLNHHPANSHHPSLSVKFYLLSRTTLTTLHLIPGYSIHHYYYYYYYYYTFPFVSLTCGH